MEVSYVEIYEIIVKNYKPIQVSDTQLVAKLNSCRNRLKGSNKTNLLNIFYSLIFFSMKCNENTYNDSRFCIKKRNSNIIPVQCVSPYAKGIAYTFLDTYEKGMFHT